MWQTPFEYPSNIDIFGDVFKGPWFATSGYRFTLLPCWKPWFGQWFLHWNSHKNWGFPSVFELEGNPAFDCSCPYIYIYIYIYIHIVTGRAPSDKTKTTFKWESQLLMGVLTLSTPDRPTAKQSLVLACANLSCRGFELLLPTGLASPKWPCHFRALWLQGINTRYHPLQAPWAIMPGDI